MTASEIVSIVHRFYPDVQAIYLFGSYGTDLATEDSDLDLAILLPYDSAERAGGVRLLTECARALGEVTSRSVDLIRLRQADTVFQNEILKTGRILQCRDEAARQEFEMLIMSFYQTLQQERLEILTQIQSTGRVYDV